MSVLSDNWQKETIRLGLFIHFFLWWVLACTYLYEPGILLIAPVYHSIFYLSGWESVFVMIFSISFLGLIILSLRKRKGWIVLLAHLSIILYWYFGIILSIGAGSLAE